MVLSSRGVADISHMLSLPTSETLTTALVYNTQRRAAGTTHLCGHQQDMEKPVL